MIRNNFFITGIYTIEGQRRAIKIEISTHGQQHLAIITGPIPNNKNGLIIYMDRNCQKQNNIKKYRRMDQYHPLDNRI